MTQNARNIIGAQMALIFAYIVEQTLTKIWIDIIIWIRVFLVFRNESKLDKLASCVVCHLLRFTISEIRKDLMYVPGMPWNFSNISKDVKYCME